MRFCRPTRPGGRPGPGADPARADERLGDGRTPVDFAVAVGSHDTLGLLLQAGADPNANDALSRAAGRDDTEACRLLVEHGAEVTDRAVLGAAWRNQVPACLKLLLDRGGNPDAIGGRAALHWVAAENPPSVQLLIDAGADPNVRAPDAMDNTPLHHACRNMDSTRRLLAAGADPAGPGGAGRRGRGGRVAPETRGRHRPVASSSESPAPTRARPATCRSPSWRWKPYFCVGTRRDQSRPSTRRCWSRAICWAFS